MLQRHCRRDLQDASFFDRRPGGAAPAGELLGPAGPLAIKSAAQPPRQQLGAHSLGEAWKGETWRAPFKAPGTPGAPLASAVVLVTLHHDSGFALRPHVPPASSQSASFCTRDDAVAELWWGVRCHFAGVLNC